MKEITDLPSEILGKCFRSLSHRDLKSSVLVSEDWRAVGEDPSLWTWCQVTIRTREDLNKLSVRRLRKVRKIKIEAVENLEANDWQARIDTGSKWDVDDWEALLQALDSKELPQLEELDFTYANLSADQIASILTRITQEDMKLKKLNLSRKDLSHVEPEALAKAAVKLEEVNLRAIRMRNEQITSILIRIAQGDTKVKKLNMYGKYLSEVEPEALARAAVKVEEVIFGDTGLRTGQIISILTTIAQEDTKLKNLNLQENDLSQVEPEALANVAAKLEELEINDCQLKNEQVTSILTTVAQNDTKLKKLDLDENDLRQVETEALAKAAVKLDELWLRWTNLRNEQTATIESTIAQGKHKTKLEYCILR